MTKLTMLSINGRTIFVRLPVGKDGKVRADIYRLFGLRRGDCVYGR
jgi:hypothetical protein